MKRIVFQCYNAFCKDIFDEDDYEKNRIYVYRFLVDAAADGIVPPTILPGTFKLGSERIQVSVDALDGEGMLLDLYRERKLLDRRLQIVALKNELTLEEMKLILYLSQSYKIFDLKEASEVLNVSKKEVRRAVSKLETKKLIEVKGQRGKKNPEEPCSIPISMHIPTPMNTDMGIWCILMSILTIILIPMFTKEMKNCIPTIIKTWKDIIIYMQYEEALHNAGFS